jgi:hypothetical protein
MTLSGRHAGCARGIDDVLALAAEVAAIGGADVPVIATDVLEAFDALERARVAGRRGFLARSAAHVRVRDASRVEIRSVRSAVLNRPITACIADRKAVDQRTARQLTENREPE